MNSEASTSCQACPLRRLPLFLPHTQEELEAIESLKRVERLGKAGDELIREGSARPGLFTLREGWAFRFKTLSDGRRQILNFLLPGDFIGLQQRMSEGAAHGVTLLTDARLCVFESDAVWELHRRQPSMGYNVTWLSAHEESLVDDNLLSVGRRTAEERVATALILLYKRAAAMAPPAGRGTSTLAAIAFPITQNHLSDALGLSLAHVNKTVRKLERRGLLAWHAGRLQLLDPQALVQVADLYGDGRPSPRPLV